MKHVTTDVLIVAKAEPKKAICYPHRETQAK